MGDITELMSPYAPYVLGAAVLAYLGYLFVNRKKFKSANMIAVSAIMTALVTVATRSIQINVPATGGYMNFGDTMVMFAAMTFGPVVGLFAGGVGSALADALSPYAGWAPITLVVKGLEGLVIGYMARKSDSVSTLVIAGIAGGIIMIGGYFAFEAYILGVTVALQEVPVNIVQAVTGVLVGTGLAKAIKKRFPEIEDLF
ncbi:ECF transporter S component [Thermococcus sp. M36]|uniref:ECF transporter S component n=1 Tax=Thermococcus sp. M36 TaxID=1638261 RepID=UPI0014399184|nr:ECF transporter S component [Thermococcus sp. M36]NJE05461.1 ECF transporter S component [Thermococcus sp. M36]